MSLLFLYRQEEFEFGREFLLAVQPVREVDAPDPAVGVDLHPQSLDVVGTVGSAREVRQVELDLIPALVQPHGHRTDKGLYSGGGLVVGGPEPPPDVLVVEHLHFEREILFELNEPPCTFLMIITRKGSLIPSVFFGSAGHVMKFVDTFVPMISSTDDWMSWSVSRLMCPFRIYLSQIWRGLLLRLADTLPD